MKKIIIGIWGASNEWGHFDPMGGGWVNRLRNYCEQFASKDPSNKNYARIYNLGISGDTSTDLLKRFPIEAAARKPNVVIFAIGTNDAQYVDTEDNPRTPLPQFRNNITTLITLARQYTNTILFKGLLGVDESKTTPIAWYMHHFYTNKRLILYDSVIENMCKKNNVQYIPLRDILSPTDFFDGLHPNSHGHEKIFFHIRNFLIELGILELQ